jgi:tight adherence protein B
VILRRALALLVCVACWAALAASTGAAASAESGLHLRPTGGAQFPERSYVLSLPSEAYISPDAVMVREDGKVVKDVTVVPASVAQSGEFGVVLVIDASDSMRGDAIAGATAAARAFADNRQPGQSIAIVMFNKETNVALPLTTDSEAIAAVLAAPPPLGHATHLYDAVGQAVSMLEDANVTVRSVVVLSDGADTGSTQSLEEVGAAAEDAGVRVFSVGLRSNAFDAGALQELGRRGGGQYLEAETPADLEPIFGQLGSRLASEYLIHYNSNAPPDEKIIVSVTVDGYPGAVTAGYSTPSVSASGEPPFERPDIERFVRSTAGMVSTAALAALLIALALHFLIRPRSGGVRSRLAEFVSLPLLGTRPAAPEETKEALFDRADQSFGGAKWWARFKQDLEIGRVNIPPARILFWTIAATLLAVYLLTLIGGLIVGVLGFGIPLIVRAVVRQRANRQRQLFAEQLPDNLQVLASALRAGHSLVGALSVVVDDSPEPSRSEFKRVIADEQLGVPLEDAIEVVAERMQSRDLSQVGLVAALQHETGGNTAEVLDRVADTVRERFELRRLVRTLTAQGRMSRWVLTSLPIGLLLVITLLNPDYIEPLYTNPIGRVVLVVAGLMVVSGSLVIRKIIDIKV